MPARYMQGHPRARRCEAGQTMVEFALVLTVMVLLILGIVDLSRMAFARNAVVCAAREGARYAIVHPEAGEAEVAAHAKALVSGLDVDEMHVTVTSPDSQHVQTVVTYTFRAATTWIARFVDGGSGNGIVLEGRSLMRVE